MKKFLFILLFLNGCLFLPHALASNGVAAPNASGDIQETKTADKNRVVAPNASNNIQPKNSDSDSNDKKTEPSKVKPGEGIPLSGIGLPSNLPKFGLEGIGDPQKVTESFMLRYVINPIFIISGALAILMIIYSAGRIITARGEEDGLTAAKTTLTWAAIGLGLIMLAFTIVSNLVRIIQSQI